MTAIKHITAWALAKHIFETLNINAETHVALKSEAKKVRNALYQLQRIEAAKANVRMFKTHVDTRKKAIKFTRIL